MTNSCRNCKWRTRPDKGAKMLDIKPICVVGNEIIENLDNICPHHGVFK